MASGLECVFCRLFFFFFSSRRRHTRSCLVSWARRCVQETGINAEYMGFHPVVEGERRRKTIRAGEITEDFVQINTRVTTYGEKTLDELFPKVEGEEKKEKAKTGPKARVGKKQQHLFSSVYSTGVPGQKNQKKITGTGY
eukprot:TRINITY_DN1342_c0_g3_i1.p6 TRINITY_DN1342_c0_g3~~TRINITY_DN1342_c0_g3_i1.p6  ORF type:complete len:140 (-),score=21.25 TRINITY_DN1342_c0_g3_i1:1572-1991(-)